MQELVRQILDGACVRRSVTIQISKMPVACRAQREEPAAQSATPAYSFHREFMPCTIYAGSRRAGLLVKWNQAESHQLVPAMSRLYPPARARPAAHDQSVCLCAAAKVPHALEQLAIGNSSGGKEDILT